MGEPLIQALTALLNQCLKTEYYPKRFRAARTIVLRKPGKPDYADPGAWRPIALLSTIGKIFESIMAQRLSGLAEQHKLLPDTQMGNRKNRSTEIALELLVEQIHTIWGSKKHVATVLSLDISGAFDTVNHIRLLDNLQKKQIPLWFVRTIRSFLTERSTTIVVDGEESASRQLPAGVPQGSPLSPILFLFYNGPLLEALNLPELRLSAIGFANDINLLTYGKSTAENCNALETTHDRCLTWASTHGMRFAPKKYTLTHFTRRKRVRSKSLRTTTGCYRSPVASSKDLRYTA
jgi:retron-type reverse transcriptase